MACLHITDYKGQDTAAFIKNQLGFQSVSSLKGKTDIYNYLNSGNNGYQTMLQRLDGGRKLVRNTYTIRRKSFNVEITATTVNFDCLSVRGSNIEEFFDVIDW